MTNARAFTLHPDDAPTFREPGGLWRLMASGARTGNAFALLDHLAADEGGGAPTHAHEGDEGLYVVRGHVTVGAGGRSFAAGPGAFVAIPRRTEYSLRVDGPGARFLQFHAPAGPELLVMGLASPGEDDRDPVRPPRRLAERLSRDLGQTVVRGMPLVDPPDDGNVATQPATGTAARPLMSDAGSAPAYWQAGGLWTVLADGAATDGAYSVIEQLMPPGPQAPPHVHAGMDEVFLVLDGELEFLLESRTATVRAGAVVFVPRGTVHAFRVIGDRPARALNLYTPAGFERVVAEMAPRAPTRTLPPGRGAPAVPMAHMAAVFTDVGMRQVSVPDWAKAGLGGA